MLATEEPFHIIYTERKICLLVKLRTYTACLQKANRDEIRKNIWRADDPVDKISELLKLYPELSDFLDEKSLPTGFENILGNARPKFESVPEAEMHREVTPEVKANIEKFVNAVLEFVALEKILTTYPDCEATRKILRLYLKPGASDGMFCIYRLFSVFY